MNEAAEEDTRNRLRLWLRSERALGLGLAGPGHWEKALNVLPAAETAASRASVMPATRPAAQPKPAAAAPAAIAAVVAEAPGFQLTEPFTSPLLPVEQRRALLAAMDQEEVTGCTKCPLSQTRCKTVFGEGAPDARLMFIGEGPGFKEDQSGRPFVGPAGELLNRMIAAMGFAREQVYITNIVKCRAFMPGPPAKDRAPSPDEVSACAPYLLRQAEIIRPRVIVTLGVPATQHVLQSRASMSRLRGTWSAWHGIKVMPTWHPAYLLRREKEGDVEPKRQAWSDLQQVMAELKTEAAENAG